MSDELEEDRMVVVKDWAGKAVVRVGVFSTIVVATIVFENVFYNPIYSRLCNFILKKYGMQRNKIA